MTQQPKFLIQEGTNRVYAWTKYLSERKDMRPYEPPTERNGPIATVATMDVDPIKIQNAIDLTGTQETIEILDSADANLLSVIVEAIKQLNPEDPGAWTSAGLPNANALSAIVGFQVKSSERDAAWEEYNTVRGK